MISCTGDVQASFNACSRYAPTMHPTKQLFDAGTKGHPDRPGSSPCRCSHIGVTASSKNCRLWFLRCACASSKLLKDQCSWHLSGAGLTLAPSELSVPQILH